MFEGALGGPAVTVGLVFVIFMVVCIVLGVVFFGWRALRKVVDDVGQLIKDHREEVEKAIEGHKATIAEHRREADAKLASINSQIGALAARQEDLRLQLPEHYLKKQDFKELIEPVLNEMRLRFDQLETSFGLREKARRRKPAKSSTTAS
jgi:hypothetical protein